MFRKLLAMSLVGLASTAVACASNESSDASQSDDDLWMAKLTRWPADATGNTKVSVCWETPGFNEGKARVRAAVANSWSAVAKVAFTGWADCGTGTADLRIRVADIQSQVIAQNGKTLFGKNLKGVRGGLTINLTFREWGTNCSNGIYKLSNCIDGGAIHEFGHVLGFLHEQDRLDAPNLCMDGQNMKTDTPAGTGMNLGPYDPSSIMNYCNSAALFMNPRLSQLDIAGVQRVYGVSPTAPVIKPPAPKPCTDPCAKYGYKNDQCVETPDNYAWWCENGCMRHVSSCP